MKGRRDDETKIKCNQCDWKGMVKDAVHKYHGNSGGEAEPVDECPECGSKKLTEMK